MAIQMYTTAHYTYAEASPDQFAIIEICCYACSPAAARVQTKQEALRVASEVEPTSIYVMGFTLLTPGLLRPRLLRVLNKPITHPALARSVDA